MLPVPRKCLFCPMLTLSQQRICPLCAANPRRQKEISEHFSQDNHSARTMLPDEERQQEVPPRWEPVAKVAVPDLVLPLPEQLPCIGCNRDIGVNTLMAERAVRLRCLWTLCQQCKNMIGNIRVEDDDE